MSEREKRERASEKEKRNVGGGTKWKTKRAMGKEKHDEIRV